MIIDLDAHLRDNHAYTLSGDFELFWTLGRLGETKPSAKSNDTVSLLTKFSELKFDHRFGCPFDIKTSMPTFAMV